MTNSVYRYAVIDIGANSVRMNIYDIRPETGEYGIVTTSRNMLGLAAFVNHGVIADAGCEQLISTLEGFLSKADEYQCDRVAAFATASLRSVRNGVAITEKIAKKLSLCVTVISGEQEARFDFDAVSHRFGDKLDRRGVVLDMGGGSTEMIFFEDGDIRALTSMKIGCLALHRNYVKQKKCPPFPSRAESWNIIRYTRMVIGSKKEFRGVGGTAYLIGGTARTLAKLHQQIFSAVGPTDGYSFPASDVFAIKRRLIADMKEGGKLIASVAGDRMNSIVPGILAYAEILSYLNVKTVISSGSGVRDGFLLDFIREQFPKEAPESET